MKRFIAVLSVSVLCITMMAGCNSKEEPVLDDTTVRAEILNEFDSIGKIPRESGHEREMSTYLKTWAKSNSFEVVRDNANNVIIDVPATQGYENAKTTILHSNMDMAVVVSEGAIFNESQDSIKIISDEKTMEAIDTNLGADSGIGMATILYVLKNTENHGPIRAIFTTGGDMDLSGAEALKEKFLEADYLINFDWNSDRSIMTGSSGNINYTMTRQIHWEQPKNAVPYMLSLTGLDGGSAESDMNKGGANAVKIIGDILANTQGQGILFELAGFNGGTSSDTIPTGAQALILVNPSDQKKIKAAINESMRAFEDAYGNTDANYNFSFEETLMPEKVISFEDTGSIVSFIYSVLNGVQSSEETEYSTGQSVTNIGSVSTTSGNFVCRISAYSTTTEGLAEITGAHEAISNMCNLEYTSQSGTPVWSGQSDSDLYQAMAAAYKSLYDYNPSSITDSKHSECSLFLQKNPKLQMISIGPSIQNIGTIEESLKLNSVEKAGKAVIEFLKQTDGTI